MTNSNDPERLSAADQVFVDRIAELSEPSQMTASQRVAFTEALDARIAARRRRRRGIATVAAAAVVAALVALAVPRLFAPASDPADSDSRLLVAERSKPVPGSQLDPGGPLVPEPHLTQEPSEASGTWEEELIFASDLDSLRDASSDSAAEELPEDYAAIASLFLDV